MSSILVTGGAGFIGAHTVRRLLSDGHQVVVVDNFNPYYNPRLKQTRIEVLLKNQKVALHKINIADLPALKQVFSEYKLDKICHLAAQAGVRYSLTHPEVYEESNLKGFLNILECARHFGVKQVVYASSSSVYGSNTKLPFAETDPVDHPISLYAVTKRANELMAETYHHLFGLRVTGLRFFTVYGPFGRPDMALFLFTRAILKDQSIEVFNNGNMRRDFTYIDDIVDGVAAALEKNYENEIFNLARGESQVLNDFISAIEKETGKLAIKKLMPIAAGDVPVTSADITKARRMLNYEPKFSIDLGIKNFVDWYRDYRHLLEQP